MDAASNLFMSSLSLCSDKGRNELAPIHVLPGYGTYGCHALCYRHTNTRQACCRLTVDFFLCLFVTRLRLVLVLSPPLFRIGILPRVTSSARSLHSRHSLVCQWIALIVFLCKICPVVIIDWPHMYVCAFGSVHSALLYSLTLLIRDETTNYAPNIIVNPLSIYIQRVNRKFLI